MNSFSNHFSHYLRHIAKPSYQKNIKKMAPLPKRAVITVTSAKADLFNGKETTGVFISEALHPFRVFRDAGFEVDLVSETGKYTPDWLSLQPDFLKGSDREIYDDPQSEFRQKLDNMPKPAELDGNSYGIFFASAGHAALIDYPTATGLQKNRRGSLGKRRCCVCRLSRPRHFRQY